jgi:hypothetical protein
MSGLPNIVSATIPVTRAANIVGPVVDCDRDAAGIPRIIRAGAVITRVSGIIPFTASCPKND